MNRRTFAAIAAMTIVAFGTLSASAQGIEKKSIKLAVGGKASLYYLPLTLCENLGFFKEQGLDVEISDFAGGAKSLQALVGGSADVVTGAYEHTIRMQTKGQDIRAVIELGRYPAIDVVARKDRGIATAADLKGKKIGVSAPGSSTQMITQYAMVKAGLKPDDASFIGVGLGAAPVAAFERGDIDALANTDPAISKVITADGAIRLADTSTTEGVTKLLGGPMSAAVLYVKQDFIQQNPNTVQALVNALYKTLKWAQAATPEQIATKVPEEYMLGDKALYLKSLVGTQNAMSRTGAIEPETQARSLAFLQQFDDELKAAKIDLTKTWDGRFVAKAAETIK